MSTSQISEFQEQKRSLLLPQTSCVLSADDTTRIPWKAMTSHAAHADECNVSMLYGIE